MRRSDGLIRGCNIAIHCLPVYPTLKIDPWALGVWALGVWALGVWALGVWALGVWALGVWRAISRRRGVRSG